MLDRLKPLARHALIAAVPIVASLVLQALPGLQKAYAADATISLFLTLAVLILTPLTKQYGVGSKR